MKLHPKVAAVEPYIVDCLDELAGHFTDDMRFAFIAWCPGKPECELVTSSVDRPLSEIRDVITRRMVADEAGSPNKGGMK